MVNTNNSNIVQIVKGAVCIAMPYFLSVTIYICVKYSVSNVYVEVKLVLSK